MNRHNNDDSERIAIFLLTGGVIFAVISYLTVAFLCFTASLQLPAVLPTLGGVVRVPWHWQHLSAAFPPQVRKLLPGNAWIPLILLTLLAAAGAAAAWVHLDRLKGQRRMALRSYDPRSKVAPRAWARPRDLRHLRKRVTDSWTMLRLDGRRIGTAPETHVLLVAPAGSGKTTGPVTTWTVEHEGPLVVTSAKADIVKLTAGARLARGPVWIYAPGVDPRALPLPACGWTPLTGCEDWEYAQRMAGWLAASGLGGNDVKEGDGARFYNAEASRLIAVLMHAAALAGEGMDTVYRWVRTPDDGGLVDVLERRGHPQAQMELEGVQQADTKQRSFTSAAAGQMLDAYRHEPVVVTDREDFTAQRLIDEQGTLFLVAPEAQQGMVAPLFAGLLASLFRAAEHHALVHGPLDPQLRIVLDETRRLAAIDQLPDLLSISRGWGVRIATVWQNLGQIYARYGEHAAEEVLGNSLAKLVLGPIQDPATRRYVVELLDEHHGEQATWDVDALGGRRVRSVVEHREGKVSAQILQQLPRGQGILIHGRDLPAKGRVRGYWENRTLRRQLQEGQAHLDAVLAAGRPAAAASPDESTGPRVRVLRTATEIAQLITSSRRDHGLSREQLAGRAGIPPQLLAHIEAGQVGSDVTPIAAALRVCGWEPGPPHPDGICVQRA